MGGETEKIKMGKQVMVVVAVVVVVVGYGRKTDVSVCVGRYRRKKRRRSGGQRRRKSGGAGGQAIRADRDLLD